MGIHYLKPPLNGFVYAFLTCLWVATVIWVLLSYSLSWPLVILILMSGGCMVATFWHHYHALPRQTKRKITELAQTIQAVNPALSATLSLDHYPVELHSLVDAINRFLRLEQERLNHEHAFSAEASHQLRTPLAGIRLQAQIAQRVDTAEKRTKALNNIVNAIDRNTRLVDQLLSYSRLTSFHHANTSPVTDLIKESKELLAQFAEKAHSNNIEFEQCVDSKLPKVPWASQHVELMLKNLVDNAITYTPESGRVLVKIEPVGNTVVLRVEDSGPGIPSDEYQQVQSPFKTSANGKKHGTGLGLAIVKRIAEIYDTTLDLSASELGGLSASIKLKT